MTRRHDIGWIAPGEAPLAPETYGEKAAWLSRAAALGLPVPPAFVLPATLVEDPEAARAAICNALEKLEELPGVGHKTASVVVSQAFGRPAFPVDTHIHRLAYRWTLSTGKNVKKTEEDLKKVFPREKWNKLHLQIIYFGREYCPARGHDPRECPICSKYGRKSLF
ncbi:MAG: hypothetical protein R3350_05935 [Saprospiraceae bacterium]|nr:hypothetical protein [Saprospiraceae bacterium]